MVVSKGVCVKCALERKSFRDIDLSDPSILAVKGAEIVISAGRSIVQAVERAYLDPRYFMCHHRLFCDFEELCGDMATHLNKA
jgi:hypothetical protein